MGAAMNSLTPHQRHIAKVREVSERRKVAFRDVMSKSMARSVVEARWECFALLRSDGLSTTQIGAFFDKDHTTIIHGLRQAARNSAEIRA